MSQNNSTKVICCKDCSNYGPSPFGHSTIGWCKLDGKHRGQAFFCAYAVQRDDKHKCKEAFPKRLAEVRRAKGLTQEELAELLGVTRTTVVYWESGRVYPRVNLLQEIVKTLEVSADWLTGVVE